MPFEKTILGGVLLSAIALDGNNGFFPLSVAVVECENKDSWGFFIEYLHTIIGFGTHARYLSIVFSFYLILGIDYCNSVFVIQSDYL